MIYDMRFFDMDGTICESREKISAEMTAFLSTLPTFVVIGGLDRKRMEYQLDGLNCILLAQSGNDAPDWQNKLSKEEEAEIMAHIRKIERYYKPYSDAVEMIEHRGCQISVSFTGHGTPIEHKRKFDPDGAVRTRILQ